MKRAAYSFTVEISLHAPTMRLARRVLWLAGVLRRALRLAQINNVEVEIVRSEMRTP